MAIVRDRVTSAAGARQETARRARCRTAAWRRPLLGAGAGAAAAAVLVYLSHTYVWAAEFPGEGGVGSAGSRGADEHLLDLPGEVMP